MPRSSRQAGSRVPGCARGDRLDPAAAPVVAFARRPALPAAAPRPSGPVTPAFSDGRATARKSLGGRSSSVPAGGPGSLGGRPGSQAPGQSGLALSGPHLPALGPPRSAAVSGNLLTQPRRPGSQVGRRGTVRASVSVCMCVGARACVC